MKSDFSNHFAARPVKSIFSLLCGAALFLSLTSPSLARQKDKKKKNESADSKPTIPMGDEQQIEYLISEMLGAWQVNDVEKLRKDYADDVSVVNGMWAPPVFGWTSYLAAYQQQRARMQQVRMDRQNTYIKLFGSFAWACYQWDFSGVVDGQPTGARGQTTLIFEKRTDHWVIVHNHTSVAPTAQAVPPANTPQITQPQPTSSQPR